MKRLSAILILAALSGCYSIRDFREWSDHHDRMTSMMINSYNNLQMRVESLETYVRYLNRHALPRLKPFNPRLKTRAESETENEPLFAPRAWRGVSAHLATRNEK